MVLIAVTAVILYTPLQSEDSFGEELDIYTVAGGSAAGDYGCLAAAIDAINEDTDGSEYTITVAENDLNVSTFTLNEGKIVTLRSSDGKLCVLTMADPGIRHGIVLGELTLENIVLDGNKTGGGIEVETDAYLTMNEGATIRNCTTPNATTDGGAVYSDGTFTMNSGSALSDNKVARNGAAVFSTGTFTLDGGVISRNTSGHGNVSSSGIFNMISGTIGGSKDAKNTAIEGGGVQLGGGTFNMYGGEISYNETNYYGGAGVAAEGYSVFNMYGGKISYNHTTSGGGGVLFYNVFNMYGGEISYNTASLGGGVENQGSGVGSSVFNMTGDSVISNNIANSGGGVYVDSGIVNLSGNARISDNAALNLGGTLTFGGGLSMWYNSVLNMSDNAVVSGNYADYGGGVCVYYESTIMMWGDAQITDNTAVIMGGGVFNWNNSDSTVKGNAVISDNKSASGGGIYNHTSIFNLSGNVVISGNKSTSGGGVYNNPDGTFNMTGGEISYNSGERGGGIFNIGTFDMDGGVVSGNTANYGGGIYNANLFDITGGSIIGNTAKGPDASDTIGSGGGIYTENFAKLTVGSGVVLSGNVAPTLRVKDIAPNADIDKNGIFDLRDYTSNISPGVVLDNAFGVIQNAPAYNNYDINYPGDIYVVMIAIEPNGSGTVTYTYTIGNDIVNEVMTADGHFFVSPAAGPITFSAVPEDDYKFAQFIINGDKFSDDSKDIKITGHTEIVAKFSSLTVTPHNHTITAAADDGSTITPDGEVKVPHGEDMKFTFSPKPGYRITAVYVNHIEISLTYLEAGEYTFFDVKNNHTIRVESEADNGNGGTGTGPGGNNGTGPGGNNGTGTGPGGNGGTGPGGNGGTGPGGNDGGNSTGTDSNDGTGSAGSGKWAVLNLVCAIIALFAGIVAVIAERNRRRKEKNNGGTEDERRRSKTAFILRALALIVGVVSVIVFFLTEDWKLPVVPMDGWTPLMFILLLAALILTMVSFRFDEDAEEKEDTSSQGNS